MSAKFLMNLSKGLLYRKLYKQNTIFFRYFLNLCNYWFVTRQEEVRVLEHLVLSVSKRRPGSFVGDAQRCEQTGFTDDR